MSKKSKKILAYLMFFAALCGTPAVSEARGSSGDQVKTAQASAAQRGNPSQSLFSYFVRNYGLEVAKAIFYGGGSFGFAKFLKAGDLNTWARYLFNFKDAESKDAEKLMNQFKQEKKKFESEKSLFEQNRAKALNDNAKLNSEKVTLELSNKTLNAQVKESKKKIEELESSKAKLEYEVSSLKGYNNQLLNINNGDNQKIDVLLSSYLPVKIAGELDVFADESWKKNSYNEGGNWRVGVTPYFSSQGDVIVASAKYSTEGEMLGHPEWLTLKADKLFGALAERAGDGELVNVSLKDIGLTYCGIPYLARYSYSAGDDVLVFYFPIANAQPINVAKNNNENNENDENINENNNVNNENNENVNNEDNNQ